MKIVRYRVDSGATGFGVVEEDGRITALAGSPLEEIRRTDEVVAQPTLLAPIEPPNVFAIGRNYSAHAAETGSKPPERPLVFQIPTTAVTGPDTEIVPPAHSAESVDYEAELAIVVGRTARRVGEPEALSYVLGYTCANDVTARDCQRADKQWTRAKGFDTFCPLGPWIVTRDAVNPDDCGIRSRLNGQVMQDSRTSNMLFSCSRLVSYLSHQFTLLPGTVILTGTPEGVGMARQPPLFMRPGDTIEVEIDGIGTLVNRVGPG